MPALSLKEFFSPANPIITSSIHFSFEQWFPKHWWVCGLPLTFSSSPLVSLHWRSRLCGVPRTSSLIWSCLVLLWTVQYYFIILWPNFWELKKFTLAGVILGVALLTTSIISIGAIIQRNHVTIGLVLLNYALLVDAIGILVIGTIFWFSTLQERAEFHNFWVGTSPTTKIALQDMAGSSSNILSAYLKDSNSFSVAGISAGLI